MADWVCYLLMSLDSNDTYIGSTNNPTRRLNNHNNNNNNIKRRGAKRTRGQTWIPILIVTGFHHKNACLSFEAGWKKLAKKRNNNRLIILNTMIEQELTYSQDTKWNRIMDLLYFTHHFTLLDTHFRINYDMRHPLCQPEQLTINVFMEDWICRLPWPHFISSQYF